jgi:hypothetical protein
LVRVEHQKRRPEATSGMMASEPAKPCGACAMRTNGSSERL